MCSVASEKDTRCIAVDIARLAAILGVIIIHFTPQFADPYLTCSTKVIGRWSVAFFFLVSGYYYAVALLEKRKDAFSESAKRCYNIYIYSYWGCLFGPYRAVVPSKHWSFDSLEIWARQFVL